jgi:hypothetical protein
MQPVRLAQHGGARPFAVIALLSIAWASEVNELHHHGPELEPELCTEDSLMMIQTFVHPQLIPHKTGSEDKSPAVPALTAAAPAAIPDTLPASNCYQKPWVEDMVHADPDGDGKVFLDIGCNTGTDAVMWLERWGKTPGVAQLWDDGLKKYDITCTGCGHSS